MRQLWLLSLFSQCLVPAPGFLVPSIPCRALPSGSLGAAAPEAYRDLSSDSNGECLFRVIQPPEGKDESNPTRECKVKVNYVIKVQGGDLVDSTESKDPFEFTLGAWPSEAMFGWDKALAVMRRGEVAEVVCGPQYAYGSKGAPPKIPPNATLECELELLDWVDYAAQYRRPEESEGERRKRWEEDIASAEGALKEEVGLDRAVQAATSTPEAEQRQRYIDPASEEGRRMMKTVKLEGGGKGYTYVERYNYLDIRVPVPEGTTAEDVECELRPGWMKLVLAGREESLMEGELDGRLNLDGSFWCLGEPDEGGGLSVEIYMDKKPPHDIIWEDVFKSQRKIEEEEQRGGADGRSQKY
ncbi:unnamed protein product [Chrysoparadoxa australica]